MMHTKTLLLITIALFVITSKSQPAGDMEGPGGDMGTGVPTDDMGTDMGGEDMGTGEMDASSRCDINGADATYNETIDGELRLITANGCPNHYSECTGKEGTCVDGETEASPSDKNINIPAYPCFNNYTDDSEYNWAGYPVYCLLNNLGIMLNGVSIFSPSANTECRDAIGQESESFDTCGGHAGPGGMYHYHAGPACLLEQVGDRVDVADGHSPQIGWAYDGFPVYGPHGLDGEYILLCTQNNSNSSDCLDNCSGHSHHTIDGFKYHYHIAGPVGDLESSPLYPTPESERWPYTFGCYRGIPSDWSQTSVDRPYPELECVESGVTDDYVPKAVDGITDVFWYAAQEKTTTTNIPATTIEKDTTTTKTAVTTKTDTTVATSTPSSSDTVQITGWIYADNWFQLYFNGEKVAEDTISYIPHNAMYINFTAPAEGSYSFAFWAQDYGNESTGLEPRMDGTGVTWTGDWCMGDGGITIALSDGTVSSSDWKCTVVMEGPLESACQDECIDLDVMSPSQCTTQFNDYADCWNEIMCPEATMTWSSATEYTTDEVGWGRSPNSPSFDYPNICSGLDATSTEQIYIDEGCVPSEKDWGDAVPIWTDDLDLHNRIICRYGYTVQSSTSSPETTDEDTDIQNTMDNGADEFFRFYSLVIAFIFGMILI